MESMIDILLNAVKEGDIKKVKLILASGADVNEKNKHGETAIDFAAFYGHIDICKLLIEKGSDVNTKQIMAFLHL